MCININWLWNEENLFHSLAKAFTYLCKGFGLANRSIIYHDYLHCDLFLIFIDGHVTQELASVMAAITMAPNVMAKRNDAEALEAEWHET